MSGRWPNGGSDPHGSGHELPGEGSGERKRGPERLDDLLVSASILRRRHAAARARRRRLLLGDATIALAIVLALLIAGIGVGMLGVVAVLVLIGFGLAPAVGGLRRRRLRRRG